MSKIGELSIFLNFFLHLNLIDYMCVRVCVCIYMAACVHAYLRVCLLCVYVHITVHECMSLWYVYAGVYMHVLRCEFICVNLCVFVCVCDCVSVR